MPLTPDLVPLTPIGYWLLTDPKLPVSVSAHGWHVQGLTNRFRSSG